METFGTKLKQARLRAGLTKARAARRLGVYWNVMHNWEEGRHVPTFTVCCLLAAMYGCSVDDFRPAPASAAGLPPCQDA